MQAHRGGRARLPENTLAAFANALSDDDISTLEFDTGITQDRVPVVLHDRTVNGSHCVDTAPVTSGDPEFPYVGRAVHDLTLAQLKTLDCGSKTLSAELPQQQAVPGARIPTLEEVLDLVNESGRDDIRLNIETKLSPTADDTIRYKTFTHEVVREIKRAKLIDRTTLQSFDWRTIQYS
ncbi:glycerophosphodiester phosphodiesterase family protein, partial [Motilibacter deserti]|uniref:glycerophosphodiester phosphodiesterase family protein n=1 Tax=Motilibacter deserti TaxID=2714956 RepID=UPI0038B35B82